MSAPRPAIALVAIVAAAVATLTMPSAEAMQRTIKAKAHNYPQAPVTLGNASLLLIEKFSTPGQFATPGAKVRQTRVRYANRAGMAPSSFMLQGQVACRNQGKAPIEVISITIVLLDAFDQPIQIPRQEPRATQQIVRSSPRGTTSVISWEQSAPGPEGYGAAIVVNRVRFEGGDIWLAPGEELIDIF